MVVAHLGARLQAGEIRAGVRLAHPDAPDRVAADRRGNQLLLLLVAVLEQARGDDRVPGEVSAADQTTTRERLQIYERLYGRAVATTALGRVAGDHPTVVEQRRLPVTEPLGHELALVTDVLEVEADGHLRRRVLVEEGDQVRAKCLVLGVPRELHFTPPLNEPMP